MEKQGIPPNTLENPPPPYAYGQGAIPPSVGYAPAAQPISGGEYYPGSEKVPLSTGPYPGYPVPPQGAYCNQPMGYGQQPQTVVFVQPTPLSNPPQDHLIYSIFVTVCCCWIIGLFAIIRAAECRTAVAAGDRTTAELKSRQAKKLANIALGLGIVSIVVAIVLIVVYYAILMSQISH